MEVIVADGCRRTATNSSARFQQFAAGLRRASCRTTASLVIDAKFPLEAMTALARAPRPTTSRKLATARVRTDIGKHIDDIAAKYLITGETQDMALMFIPSESMLCRAL